MNCTYELVITEVIRRVKLVLRRKLFFNLQLLVGEWRIANLLLLSLSLEYFIQFKIKEITIVHIRRIFVKDNIKKSYRYY